MFKLYMIFIAIVILFASCKKNDHATLLTARDFPVSIGSWWQYQLLNQNGVIFDTMTIKILDIASYNNSNYERWVLTSHTGYINDTIFVLPSDSAVVFPSYTINFPILSNQSWAATPTLGVSYTTNIQNVTVDGSTFNNSIYLNKYAPYNSGIYYNESIWVVKNIGIVKHIINNYNQSYFNEQLIAYHII